MRASGARTPAPGIPPGANKVSGPAFTRSVAPKALSRRAALAGLLATSGCAVQLAAQERYAGEMQRCTAAPGGTQPAAGQHRATLVRQADRFSFAPTDGTLVIAGTVAPDGNFTGSLATNPSRHGQEGNSATEAQPFTLSVAGRLDAAAATGTYTTPRCRVTFRLPRMAATLLP